MVANVWMEESNQKVIKYPQVVEEFIDVFSEKFPGKPMVQEIKFTIDLLPCAKAISMPAYEMASAELTKLKTQLVEL